MAFWDDIVNKLSQTWPARMGQGILGAAALPGDVYAGRTDPGSNEAIGRAADLAGILGGSAFVAPAQRNAVGAGIRAYHGSPYDFSKFDLSRIGTGEGAQAYGHGLYFAENPAVAGEYRKNLAPGFDKFVAGEPYNRDDPLHLAAGLVKSFGDRKSALRSLAGDISDPSLDLSRRQYYQSVSDLIASGKPLPEVEKRAAGKMYEVNINAKPEQFLDWDKQILNQSPELQAKVSSLPLSGDAKNEALHYNAGSLYSALARELGGMRRMAPEVDGGYMIPYSNEPAATKMLSEAGIPGIRYLDQFSRPPTRGGFNQRSTTPQELADFLNQQPKETSNYVVFNPDIVDILKKYGLVGALGASQLTPQGNEQ